jgi:hypothetical protein
MKMAGRGWLMDWLFGAELRIDRLVCGRERGGGLEGKGYWTSME